MANYQNQISSILYHEGGLSKHPADSASAYPVPDGSGYHTNKGITWQTFTTLAPTLGYQATPQLFYDMPENIWLSIYKVGYWDKIKGDQINSQPIADLLVQIAWGSGVRQAGLSIQRTLVSRGRSLNVDGVIGPITVSAINAESAKDEEGFYKDLWAHRMSFLQGLQAFATFGKGWTRRMNDIYMTANAYFDLQRKKALKAIQDNPLTTVAIVVLLGVTFFF